MLLGVAQVMAAQRFEVLVRIIEMLARKLLEAAAHHFGQQMVAAKKLSVNSTLSFRAAFHAVFGRRHDHTQAS
jgi:hypothetical protein